VCFTYVSLVIYLIYLKQLVLLNVCGGWLLNKHQLIVLLVCKGWRPYQQSTCVLCDVYDVASFISDRRSKILFFYYSSHFKMLFWWSSHLWRHDIQPNDQNVVLVWRRSKLWVVMKGDEIKPLFRVSLCQMSWRSYLSHFDIFKILRSQVFDIIDF